MSVRRRIGVMVPSTNTSFEADFQLVSPRDVTILGQRLRLTNDAMGAAGMDRMNADKAPPGEAPRARRAMTDNRFYVIYALTGQSTPGLSLPHE